MFCELTTGHPGEHADHLADGEPDAQLWVRWSGDQYRFARLAPCMAPAPAREDGADDICHLFRGHEPRHSWDLVGLPSG
ncbi:hypothetical protein [Streptomyces sp. NPDC058418]|uniref:hypothetical protein n=1 Tax=unclassified Streptomyces TaxID=2593676 RepID=UPI003651D921